MYTTKDVAKILGVSERSVSVMINRIPSLKPGKVGRCFIWLEPDVSRFILYREREGRGRRGHPSKKE